MPDREKVIKAIEICYTLGHNCTECPLFSEDDCNDKLMRDTLSLLKEQEPKLMTREEADKYSEQQEKYVESEKAPVYVEYTTEKPWSRRWLTVDMLHSWLDDWETWTLYGKEWRCWTSRPTAEQRKATPWEPPKEG